MGPSQLNEIGVVKRLNAETEAVDPGISIGFKELEVDAVRIGFEGYL